MLGLILHLSINYLDHCLASILTIQQSRKLYEKLKMNPRRRETKRRIKTSKDIFFQHLKLNATKPL
jgi:hypothetical protein